MLKVRTAKARSCPSTPNAWLFGSKMLRKYTEGLPDIRKKSRIEKEFRSFRTCLKASACSWMLVDGLWMIVGKPTANNYQRLLEVREAKTTKNHG